MPLEASGSAEKGQSLPYTEVAHLRKRARKSRLRGPLWLLTFAPSYPSPFRDLKSSLSHPYTLYVVGIITALIAGSGIVVFDVIYGIFTTRITNANASSSALYDAGAQTGWIMTVVAVVTLVCFVTFLGSCSLAGLKVANELRTAYFESILSQDVSFFDHVGAGEVAARSNKDINLIRVAFGERVGYLTMNLATIIAAFISSLIQSAKLAGILFSLIPFTFIVLGVIGWWSQKKTAASDSLEATTSTAVEQVISAARIVQSFGIGDRLMAKLELESFRPLRRLGMFRAVGKSLEQTAAFFVIFVAYSLAFYAGSIVVAEGTEIGHVLTALYNVINLLFAFAMSIPHISAILEAMAVLKAIRRQIERDPLIDISNEGGLTLQASDHWQPSFKLENVTFAYPSRGHVKALDGISLDFPPATFTAVVGPSGSGKSTVASLLLREYDPETANIPREIDIEIKRHFEKTPEDDKETKKDKKKTKKEKQADEEKSTADETHLEKPLVAGSGRITFAGHDVRDLNLRWLRRQIAVVSQNPQLFAGTILDNVASGLTGTGLEYRPDTLSQMEKAGSRNHLDEIRERCEEALRQSQAWEFVEQLPEGMDTVILGGRTGVLSGGQLQRVALARALVSRPKCLLLDEATSAVASDAEVQIMDVLLQMQKSRGLTLIVIAHRLSSIASADNIIVMKQGQFVNQGTYEQLTDPENPESTFRNMVNVATGPPASAFEPKSSKHESSSNLRKRQISEGTLSVPTATVRAAEVLGPPLKRSKSIFRLNKWLLLFGTVASMIGGASFAASGLLTGYAVSSLSIPDDNARMRREMDRWSLWFLVVALGDLLFFFVAGFDLEFAGTEIKTTLTKESLRAVLRQDTEFFESSAGGSGTLTSGIAEFPGAVGNTVGVIWLQIVVALSNLAASFILGFVLSWRVAVIGIPAIVLCIVAGYFNFTWLEKFEAMATKESEKRSNFINESVNSIRTIAALTREGEIMRRFRASGETPTKQRLALLLGSVGFGVSQGVVFLFGAFVFWWGGRLVSRNEISIKDLFAVSEAVLLATMTSGRILTFVGDVSRTSNALKSIQKWLDLKPAHIKASDLARKEAGSEEPLLPDGSTIQFYNVELRYPSRPDALALNDVSLTFQPGMTYAFCGPSGSGKSSILALLQRFYEPTAGKITIGRVDIRAIEMSTARGMMGYVSQEAVLFQGTIRFNLCLGAKNPDEVSQEQLEEACRQASILDFIQNSENGFDMDLGMKGNQLSGGQKQRLCIARALLSKPKILLLDEATSALDNESQAIIQQALDRISAAPDAPTIITVAHRLSTIRNADVVLVMDKGAVVETGSHEELVKARGRYWDLIQGQL